MTIPTRAPVTRRPQGVWHERVNNDVIQHDVLIQEESFDMSAVLAVMSFRVLGGERERSERDVDETFGDCEEVSSARRPTAFDLKSHQRSLTWLYTFALRP